MTSSKDAAFYFKRSKDKFSTGDVEGAFADLDQSISLAPDNVEYRWERANLRYEGEEYQPAVEDFSAIIQHSKDAEELIVAHRKRAIFLEVLGRYDDLLADLDWLIAHNAATDGLYTWRGHHKVLKGLFSEAVEDFTAALKLRPKTNNTLLVRANAYSRLKLYDEEIADLTSVLESGENHSKFLSIVYLKRANALFRAGKLEQAVSDFATSVQLGDGNSFTDAADYFRSLSPF